MAENTKKLKITLIKSKIGAVPKNRKIVESMGFKKLNSFVIYPITHVPEARLDRSPIWSRSRNWTNQEVYRWNYLI